MMTGGWAIIRECYYPIAVDTMWFKQNVSWFMKKYIHRKTRSGVISVSRLGTRSYSSKSWQSSEIRQTFFQFFKDRDHQYVHSSSVIPPKDAGTYFVNAGMNQFKPIFLGTVDPTSEMAKYRRVVNSQKCIRISGKHNDLDDVGRDTFHHTFFEMLGNWSFGDYFKREACEMAWTLLTSVYNLPKDRLYITYFGGNEALGLESDLECHEIWREIGVSEDHIMPFGSVDNFWDMGDTGPCGPCTEIHFDRTPGGNGKQLVNMGSPEVVELWNLVFMQYDRQPSGLLLPLPSKHVDTGMGLERITAVLQNKLSNYDTDLFTPLFNTIQQNCKFEPYRGRLGRDDVDGRDTAYRIVADHARMFTVAIADGVRPGKHNIDSKLRHIIDQCLYQSVQVLELPPGILVKLVPVVVDILGGAFPELNRNVDKIKNIVDRAEHRYRELLAKGEETISKICTSGTLTGSMLVDLQDGVWHKTGIPLDISLAVAAKLKIPNVDVEGFNKIMELRKEKQRASMLATAAKKLSQQDVVHLRSQGIPVTDDHYKYQQIWSQDSLKLEQVDPCKVLAIKGEGGFINKASEGDVCMLITDNTPFYAESGGQVSDTGTWDNEDCTIAVEDVQEMNGYVLHTGHVLRGSIKIGDLLEPSIDLSRRYQCAINHTATHMLNFALRQLADDVVQQGSRVTPQKLVFDFSCSNTNLPETCLEQITSIVNQLISQKLDVFCKEVPLNEARSVPSLVTLQNEVYPSMARVVSVGMPVDELIANRDSSVKVSAELCGGCHVDNSGRVSHFVITHFEGMKQQGTKRVTALTGRAGEESLANVKKLRLSLDNLENLIKCGKKKETWPKALANIEKQLFNEENQTLPKIDRDELIERIERIKVSTISQLKNIQKKAELKQELQKLLEECKDKEYFVGQLSEPQTMKKIVAALGQLCPNKPVMIFTDVPKEKAKKTAKFLPPNISKSARQSVVVAFVPNSFTNKFTGIQQSSATARAWIAHLVTLSNGKARTVGSLDNKNVKDGDVHFITLFVDADRPVHYYISQAEAYIEKLKS